MQKHHKLIVSSGSRGFSLSNETDADIMTDYFPGAWAVSRKLAVKWAKEYLECGDTVSVTTYDNPNYAKVGNEIIRELGIDQPLFPVPAPLPESTVANGRPANLSQLKKYCQLGTRLRIKNRWESQMEIWMPESVRETEVIKVQTTSIATRKGDGKCWLDWGKASEWTFDDEGATSHRLDRDGKYVPSVRVEYI